jgi:DNA-binding transcriptional LysR family regulator
VQASQTIASYWLPRHLVAFRQAHPNVQIILTIGNSAQVAASVHQGLAELGFIEGVIHDKVLKICRVAGDQMVIVVAPDHPWAAQQAKGQAVTAAQLPEHDWVLREPGSGTRSIFESALEAFGIPQSALRVALELPSNEAVRAAVESGMGATALSASIVAPSLEAGLLHMVGPALPERDFCAIWHFERNPSPVAQTLLAMIAAVSGR